MKINLPVKPSNRQERGQSLVELAISLGVILLLLAGAVDFGMGFYSYVALQDAAQEGALYASIKPCTEGNPASCLSDAQLNIAGIRQRIRASSTVPLNFSAGGPIPDTYITAKIVPDGGRPCEGITGGAPNAVQVMVEYDYPIVMPFAGTVLGGQSIHLRAAVTDTILEPRCN